MSSITSDNPSAVHDIRLAVKAEPNENERQRLRGIVIRELEAIKQIHSFATARRTAEFQKEQLRLQHQLAKDLQLANARQIEEMQREQIHLQQRLADGMRLVLETVGSGPAALGNKSSRDKTTPTATGEEEAPDDVQSHGEDEDEDEDMSDSRSQAIQSP